MVASLVIEQTVPLLAVSLSPRAGNGNNGQPPFALHENRPTPRFGLHLRDCVAAVPFFRGYFNNPLSRSGPLRGVGPFLTRADALATKPLRGLFCFYPPLPGSPPPGPMSGAKTDRRGRFCKTMCFSSMAYANARSSLAFDPRQRGRTHRSSPTELSRFDP